MKNKLVLGLLFACQLVHAQQVELVKPRWEDFVPVEWKTILQKQGNLKKDGAADLAVIFEGNLALLLFPDLSVVDRLRTSCCVCFVYGVASLKGVLPM